MWTKTQDFKTKAKQWNNSKIKGAKDLKTKRRKQKLSHKTWIQSWKTKLDSDIIRGFSDCLFMLFRNLWSLFGLQTLWLFDIICWWGFFFLYPFSNFYFSKAPAEKSLLHQAFLQRVSTELFPSVPFSEWAPRWRLCTVQEKKREMLLRLEAL